jgi:hypothetical protein
MNGSVAAMFVMLVASSAQAGEPAKVLATLDDTRCTVVGVIGNDVVVDANAQGVFLVPRDGGAARNVYVPAKAASPQDRISFHVLGGHIVYDQMAYRDNGSYALEYLGVVDPNARRATQVADPFRNWAMTADDRYVYWADVAKTAARGSVVFRAPLAGGEKEPVFDVPGQVFQLAVYKGTLFATTMTESGRHGSLGSDIMCHEVHRQQGKHSKRLGERACGSGGDGGLTVSPSGVYFVRSDVLRRVPLTGGKETILGEAQASHVTPWTDGTVVVWEYDGTYFVAAAAAKKLAPRTIKQPGDQLAHYAVSGDHIFWADRGARCVIQRATLE